MNMYKTKRTNELTNEWIRYDHYINNVLVFSFFLPSHGDMDKVKGSCEQFWIKSYIYIVRL